MRKHKTGKSPSSSAGCVFDDVPISKLQLMLKLHAEERHTQIAFAGTVLSIKSLRRVVLSTPKTTPKKKSRAEVSDLCAHTTTASLGSFSAAAGAS